MATQSNALFRWGFLAAALLVVMEARAATIQIDIDTASLGLSAQNYDLAFDLIDSNPQPNSASISSFTISGGSLTAKTTFYTNSGNVTGDLSVSPGIVTLDDSNPVSSFFNEYTHNANLGTLITFVLEISENKEGGFDPDTFSFFFIDPATGLAFPTSDPTDAGALFVYSIGNGNQPALFCPPSTLPDTPPCVTVTPVGFDVPEPGALALAVSALLTMGFVRRTRKAPPRRR